MEENNDVTTPEKNVDNKWDNPGSNELNVTSNYLRSRPNTIFLK